MINHNSTRDEMGLFYIIPLRQVSKYNSISTRVEVGLIYPTSTPVEMGLYNLIPLRQVSK